MATSCRRTPVTPRPPSTSFFALFFFLLLLLLSCSSSSTTLVPAGVRRVGGHRADSRREPPAAVNQEAGLCASVVIPYGYKCEEFDVVTEDGYILSMQRIPGSRHGGAGAGDGGGQAMRPVLLQHGVLMGTLVALAAFSEGRLVDKVRAAALLSPVAYLSHMTTPLGILAARAFVDKMYTWLGIAKFDPMGAAATNLLKVICQFPNVGCYDLMTSITGKNDCLNESTVEFFLKYEPQPTSTRNMVHLAQTFRDHYGPVAKFDYGSRTANMKHYGQGSPPRYNMSAIPGDLPLFLSIGGRDALADVRDVELLLDDLTKLHRDPGKLAVLFLPSFAHADFVMGACARALVYGDLIAFFDRHN